MVGAGWPVWQVSLLVISLAVPWVIFLGPVAMSTYRLVLLALTVPCLMFWVSGKAGSIRAPDLLILGFCLWCGLALFIVHGAEAIESSGILFAETFGAYLIGRCYVRSAADFRATVKLLFLVIALILPFALLETVTGVKVMLEIFGAVLPTVPPTMTELRFGFMRVQGPFDHPILFGIFCGGLVALTHLVLGHEAPLAKRWTMTMIVAATALLSWSSGPIVTIAIQVMLLGWNVVLKSVVMRWRILLMLVIGGYLGLEVMSNQSVAQLLTRYAFDPWTAYYRLLIWDYGWQSIFMHPFFGTGFNEWERPAWMPPSIDMFWIVPAIRHGLPALILFASALLTLTFSIGFRTRLDERGTAYRTGYLIAITAFFLVGWTVHFWNATYVLFLFLLGSGMWMLDAQGDENEAEPKAVSPRASAPVRTRSTVGRRRV